MGKLFKKLGTKKQRRMSLNKYRRDKKGFSRNTNDPTSKSGRRHMRYNLSHPTIR